MSLDKLDGVFLNKSNIIGAYASIQLRADGDRYKIKFIAFGDREFTGDSEFATEEECKKYLEKILSCTNISTDAFEETLDEIEKLEARVLQLENGEAEKVYAEITKEVEQEFSEYDWNGIE